MIEIIKIYNLKINNYYIKELLSKVISNISGIILNTFSILFEIKSEYIFLLFNLNLYFIILK